MAKKDTDESSAPELTFKSTRLLESSLITTLQTVIYRRIGKYHIISFKVPKYFK
jgi:hypothetical protein